MPWAKRSVCSTTGAPRPTTGFCTGRCTNAARRCWPLDAETPRELGTGRARPSTARRRPECAGTSSRPSAHSVWSPCSRRTPRRPSSTSEPCGTTRNEKASRIRAPSPWPRTWSRHWWRPTPSTGLAPSPRRLAALALAQEHPWARAGVTAQRGDDRAGRCLRRPGRRRARGGGGDVPRPGAGLRRGADVARPGESPASRQEVGPARGAPSSARRAPSTRSGRPAGPPRRDPS